MTFTSHVYYEVLLRVHWSAGITLPSSSSGVKLSMNFLSLLFRAAHFEVFRVRPAQRKVSVSDTMAYISSVVLLIRQRPSAYTKQHTLAPPANL